MTRTLIPLWMNRCAWRAASATVVCALALCLVCSPAFSVPACPEGATFIQPDGTAITVKLRGDERLHWNEDSAGYLIAKSTKSKAWMYATRANGRTVATKHQVGRVDPASVGLHKLKPADMRSSVNPRAADSAQAIVPVQPMSSTIRNLVVLVSFSDLPVAYTRQEYDDLFNQIGYTADGAVGSVKDYYHEVSYNALTVASTVVEPVTLDYGYAYYGANDFLGDDVRPREMVLQALAKLEARGFDFSTVDGDGDGWIDGLTIIHGGGGEEYSGNDENYIWSHQWSISTVTYDGVSMSSYHTEPARRGFDSSPSSQGITRIGVICHETGHFLGLPDLYDYGYDSEGVGDFCLMAGGSWGGSYGNRPVHLSAYCKMSLGWVTPTVIVGSGNNSIPQVETSQTIYKLAGACGSSEYFLIENRQGVGFDQSLPGSLRGLLIWHVDEYQYNNNDQTHYKVDLEEASCTQDLELDINGGDDADYFRLGNAVSFSNSTCPNNLCYSGTACGMNISNVSATGATMTFDVSTCTTPFIVTQPSSGRLCVGQEFTFSIVADGATSYQWWKGSSAVPGATSPVYTIPSVSTESAGDYRCVASNSCSSISSDSATLTVISAPSITQGPVDQTAYPGGTASFHVAAFGGSLFYQWQVSTDGTNYANVTTGTGGSTATYATAALVLSDSGNRYRCVISGECGPEITSTAATLTVVDMNVLLSEGFENAFFDGAPFGWTREFKTGSAEWSRAEGDYQGGLAAVGDCNALLFYGGRDDHETYLVTPRINFQCSAGATLQFWHKQAYWSPDQDTLSVYYRTATGGPWSLLGSYTENVPAWTLRTLTLPNLSSTYYIGFLGNAKWGYGVCIDEVTVRQAPCPPRIIEHPLGQMVRVGRSASFAVTATGDAPLTYQWRRDGQAIDGAVASSYLITSAALSDTGSYDCVVVNGSGSVVSDLAMLVVIEPSPTIKDAKLLADGLPCALDAKAVTYADTDFFYIEEDSRACAIRIEKTKHGLQPGERADVVGTLATTSGNEHFIAATSAIANGASSIGPLAIACQSVGGSDWNYDPHSRSGQRGTDVSSAGVNTVGLLVRVYGRFQQVDATTFTLDDNSGAPIRCVVKPGTVLNSSWQYAEATGVASIYKLNNSIFPPQVLVQSMQGW